MENNNNDTSRQTSPSQITSKLLRDSQVRALVLGVLKNLERASAQLSFNGCKMWLYSHNSNSLTGHIISAIDNKKLTSSVDPCSHVGLVFADPHRPYRAETILITAYIAHADFSAGKCVVEPFLPYLITRLARPDLSILQL